MRIVHFSDTHLGHQQFSRTAPTGLNQREQDHYDAFDAIIQHCLDTRPDLVVHAGDLFDGVRPSNRALAVALSGFVRLDRAGIPVVVIAGNHEHPKMVETGSPFRLFDHLPNVHAVYKGRRETIEVAGRRVHAVPQCIDNDALRQEITSIEDGASDVLVVHGGVVGMEAFHHAEFNELSIDAAWLGRFAYVALGHYHSTTEVLPNAWYCGAPDRVSIRESGERKGFLEVVLGDTPDVTFHPVPGRPYVDLPRLDTDGLDAEAVARDAEAALAKVPDGAVVRLRIDNIDPALRSSLAWDRVRKAGAHALDVDLRPTFLDDLHRADTGVELRGLEEEFADYAATYPLEGLDRDRLLAMAREVLG